MTSPGSTEGSRRRSLRGALVAVALLGLLLAASALAAVGGLTQKPGTAGCISETGTAGACVDGTALDVARSVTISPDGTSAYVASQSSDAVAIFDRNPTTGALIQKPGTAGCISETTPVTSPCTDGTALNGAISVTISPDGTNAYVASIDSDAVAILDRNPTTGALTQKPGTPGCISLTGSAGACIDGTELDSPVSVTISPDGTNAYVASFASDAVTIFDRNTTTGALTQKPGSAGCISETGAGACADGTALDGASSVTISPDGTNAYAASANSGAIALFDRNTTTGALTQKPGTAGCISETGSAGACIDGAALFAATSVTISPDGANAYVASSISDALTIFDRNTTTGALTQKPGTAGCISETGNAGACTDGVALAGARSVTISPDGTSAYVASNISDAVTIFDRNTTTGALTQKVGAAGCISETGTAGACIDGTALDGAVSVTISPDGTNAYVASNISDAVAIFDRDIPPQTTITKKPKARIKTRKKSARIKVSFSSETGATFECKLDNKPFKPCSSPFSAKAKSKGGRGKMHKISIRATDQAGNAEIKAAIVKFKLVRKR